MRVNHNWEGTRPGGGGVVSDLCKDTKMRVNHNLFGRIDTIFYVVSDLCKDTKMRVNHNAVATFGGQIMLFLIYAKILK